MQRTLLLIGALALALAACSSADGAQVASLEDTAVTTTIADDTSGEVSQEDAILAFSACMRENGIEDFEDPEFDADGGIAFGFRGQGEEDEIDRDAMRQAMEACRVHLEGLAFGPGNVDRGDIEDQLYEFAACMRENGIDMPDPDFSQIGPGAGGDGEPGAGGPFAGAFDPEDPEFVAAMEACQELFGGRFGGPGRGPGGGAPPSDG